MIPSELTQYTLNRTTTLGKHFIVYEVSVRNEAIYRMSTQVFKIVLYFQEEVKIIFNSPHGLVARVDIYFNVQKLVAF